jgi:hypothetical protein
LDSIPLTWRTRESEEREEEQESKAGGECERKQERQTGGAYQTLKIAQQLSSEILKL